MVILGHESASRVTSRKESISDFPAKVVNSRLTCSRFQAKVAISAVIPAFLGISDFPDSSLSGISGRFPRGFLGLFGISCKVGVSREERQISRKSGPGGHQGNFDGLFEAFLGNGFFAHPAFQHFWYPPTL